MQLKLRKKSHSKKAEATGDLIGNIIANKITKFQKTRNKIFRCSETNEHDKEMP